MLRTSVAGAVLLLGLASLAHADVVFLKGGQRLEGEIAPKGNGFEIKNEFGAWTFTKDEVVKIVKSYEKIVADGDAMRAQARAFYDEALQIGDTDTKAANAKLRQGLELLRKIADSYNEAMETYTDPKYGNLQKVVVTIFQEMRLYRDKIHSELAPVVVAKPPEPPPTPPPVASVKGPVKRPAIDPALYLPKAMAGDVEAMFVLGAFYDEKSWSSVDGQKWLRAAADKGHARAQDRVGLLYALGKGVKQDPKEAQRWFLMAEKSGLPLARVHLGLQEWQGALGPRSLEKAYQWCEKAAEGLAALVDKGDVEAQLALAWMLQEGMGKVQDHKKALDLYQEAADTEYGPAENQLGVVYRDGRAGEKNASEAAKYLQRAAEHGYAEAQVNLGELTDDYTGHKAAQKDFVRSKQWYDKAAEQGHGRGLYRLGLIQLDGKGVLKNPAEAVKYFKLSLNAGTEDFLKGVLNDLGYVYEKGQGVKADATEAMKNYKLAADLGSLEAQYNLGAISLEKNNEKDAYKWFVMAAKQGHALAQNNLGAFHAQGKTVKKNLDEAEKWFLMAAQQGDATAAENLKKLQKERPKK